LKFFLSNDPSPISILRYIEESFSTLSSLWCSTCLHDDGRSQSLQKGHWTSTLRCTKQPKNQPQNKPKFHKRKKKYIHLV
jgi:hypothetical protein